MTNLFVYSDGHHEVDLVEPIYIFIGDSSNISLFLSQWEKKLEPYEVCLNMSGYPPHHGDLSRLNISRLQFHRELDIGTKVETKLLSKVIPALNIYGTNSMVFFYLFGTQETFVKGVKSLCVEVYDQFSRLFENVTELSFARFKMRDDFYNVDYPFWPRNLKSIDTKMKVNSEHVKMWYDLGVRRIESEDWNLTEECPYYDLMLIRYGISFRGKQNLTLLELVM